jgi:hypothetical protein
MKTHIKVVMAADNQERFEYVMNWLAWAVQHPDQRAEVALVFKGKKGTGKGTLGGAMMRIFGQHGYHVSSAGQLVGKHHNAHLRDCSFLFADEALWPGDRAAEGNLKRMVTEPTLDIEAKYFDSVEVPNQLHILMASNENWIVPTSEGERRYVMFEVSDVYMQQDAWFEPLYQQLEDGGLAAMLYDLLYHKLNDWHPRQLPKDTGLLDQQRQSLQPLDAWICELLESGRLTGCDPLYPNRAVSNSYDKEVDVGSDYPRIVKQLGIYDQARASVPKLRSYTSDHLLGAHLRELGCTSCKLLGGRRGWSFPSLKTLRQAWEERFGGWNWHSPEITAWQAEVGGKDTPLNDREKQDAKDASAARGKPTRF